MNQQVEWMSARMFQFGVNVSHALDDAFGIPRKTTLSQRDVPGMTRGVRPACLSSFPRTFCGV